MNFILIILIFVGFNFTSCNTKSKSYKYSNSYVGGDTISIKYRGIYSNYSWDFRRIILGKLALIGKRKTTRDIFSIHSHPENIIGLSKDMSKLYLITDSLYTIDFWDPSKSKIKHNEKSKIFNFEYSGNDIYFFDFAQKSIKKFDISNDTLLYYTILNDPIPTFRACHLNKDKYLYVSNGDSNNDFNLIFLDSSIIIKKYSLHNLFDVNKDVIYQWMIYDGNFVYSSDNNNYVVYYCQFTGFFICINKLSGDILYTAKTIDKTPPPTIKKNKIAQKTFNIEVSPNINFFIDAAISNNQFFLLNSIDPNQGYVVDIYDLEEKGKYVGSIYIPELKSDHAPLSIAFKKGLLYILYDDQTIAKFRIDTTYNKLL
ncbi:MAG: hypothetical protein B6D37_09275 [Sphingobacteriales bacterium UTBCD1]|jgi:hypothetical protein|nr:MAG: hypothetical protein B6D37_09275 [Sphingobacteriales bacterium UTBCD1]